MRTAIFSDIHSNLEAMTACIKHAERHQVQRFVTLGDYVGYGPDPCKTLDQLDSGSPLLIFGTFINNGISQSGCVTW